MGTQNNGRYRSSTDRFSPPCLADTRASSIFCTARESYRFCENPTFVCATLVWFVVMISGRVALTLSCNLNLQSNIRIQNHLHVFHSVTATKLITRRFSYHISFNFAGPAINPVIEKDEK